MLPVTYLPVENLIQKVYLQELKLELSYITKQTINSGNNQIILVLKVFVWTAIMQLPGKHNHTKNSNIIILTNEKHNNI